MFTMSESQDADTFYGIALLRSADDQSCLPRSLVDDFQLSGTNFGRVDTVHWYHLLVSIRYHNFLGNAIWKVV